MATLLINLVISFLLLAPAFAETIEWNRQSEARLWTGYRDLNQVGLTTQTTTLDSLVTASHRIQGVWSGFEFEIRPEIRTLQGTSGGLKSSDLASLTVKPAPQLTNLEWNLGGNSNYLVLDRLNLKYATDTVAIQAGRSMISLGVLRFFPIWNRFTRPAPNAYGPGALVMGRDSFIIRIPRQEWSFQSFGIFGPQNQGGTENHYGFESTFFGGSTEAHLLVGQWFQKRTIGAAIAQDVGGKTLRLEILDFDGDFQSGAGAEWALDDQWSFLGELAYFSDGAGSKNSYSLTRRSNTQILNASFYSYLQLRIKPNPDWATQVSLLSNWVDRSQYAGARLEYTPNQTLEFSANALIPLGPRGGEFSTQALVLPLGMSLGAPVQIFADAKVYF